MGLICEWCLPSGEIVMIGRVVKANLGGSKANEAYNLPKDYETDAGEHNRRGGFTYIQAAKGIIPAYIRTKKRNNNNSNNEWSTSRLMFIDSGSEAPSTSYASAMPILMSLNSPNIDQNKSSDATPRSLKLIRAHNIPFFPSLSLVVLMST